ncbi:hypothetical protein C8R44DRAFT_732915 [Mycena epipterygia]|nr:hypothetical protein C8R44DRAFT_732915 [Mycena epipterygia]
MYEDSGLLRCVTEEPNQSGLDMNAKTHQPRSDTSDNMSGDRKLSDTDKLNSSSGCATYVNLSPRSINENTDNVGSDEVTHRNHEWAVGAKIDADVRGLPLNPRASKCQNQAVSTLVSAAKCTTRTAFGREGQDKVKIFDIKSTGLQACRDGGDLD